MNFESKSAMFSDENIAAIEKVRNCRYVIDTEHQDVHVAIFYGDKEHPDSGSRYFALYYTPENKLMITDGSFIEDQDLVGVLAKDGEVIYSRYRHDYVTSADGTAMVDGGRAYLKSSLSPKVRITVVNGYAKAERIENDSKDT